MPRVRRKSRTETTFRSTSCNITGSTDRLTLTMGQGPISDPLSRTCVSVRVKPLVKTWLSHASGPIARYRRYESTFVEIHNCEEAFVVGTFNLGVFCASQ